MEDRVSYSEPQRVVYEQQPSISVKAESLSGGKFKCSVSLEHSQMSSQETVDEVFSAFMSLMAKAYEAGFNQEERT